MYLTDLADVLRRGGLAVEEMAGWRERGHGAMGGVRTIVCHHTAGPASGEAPSLNFVMRGSSALAGPLSHLVLGRSGTWYVVAAGLCWHAGVVWSADQGNSWAIGIEAEATGTAAWPDEQYRSYARGCRVLADHYRLGVDRVLGHKEVAKPAGRKIDPNFDMDAFRRAVAAAGQEDDLDANQHRMLSEIHREATQRLRRRIDGSTYTDTVLGYAMNADSFGYRAAEALDRIEQSLTDLSDRLSKLEES